MNQQQTSPWPYVAALGTFVAMLAIAPDGYASWVNLMVASTSATFAAWAVLHVRQLREQKKEEE